LEETQQRREEDFRRKMDTAERKIKELEADLHRLNS